MSKKSILIISTCLCFYALQILAQEVPYPYEQCNWQNRDFTNRIVRESQNFSHHQTEAKAICLNCRRASFQKNHLNSAMRTLNQATDIPEICFLAGALSQITKQPHKSPDNWYYCPGSRSGLTRERMRFTGSDCSRNDYSPCKLDESNGRDFFENFKKDSEAKKNPWAFAQRPCLSKDYIRMTAKAFNETANCFGFNSKEDKGQLFALMQHQSSFLLNKKTKNQTAGCYGQLNSAHITSINSYIHTPEISSKYHKIYEDMIKKCPHFTSKINLLNHCRKPNQTVYAYRRCLKKKPNSEALMCQTSQDPYSCLFYTLYNIKKYKLSIKTKLDQHQDAKTVEHSHIGKHFKWPVKINEMLIVKGNVKGRAHYLKRTLGNNAFINDLRSVSGTKRSFSVNGVYKDSTPVIRAFNKFTFPSLSHFQFNSRDTQVKKVKIFDEHKLKWAFLHLAHDKGISIIHSHLTPFMQHMKGQIMKNEKYKSQILAGDSLDMSIFIKEFNAYAKTYEIEGKEQPANLLHNVSQGLNSLTNKDDQLEKGIKAIYKFQDFNSKEINNFTKLTKKHCPTKLL